MLSPRWRSESIRIGLCRWSSEDSLGTGAREESSMCSRVAYARRKLSCSVQKKQRALAAMVECLFARSVATGFLQASSSTSGGKVARLDSEW